MNEIPKKASSSGKMIGLIFVLFILVTIVTRVCSDSPQQISTVNGENPPITIADFGNFYIYNQSELRMETTLLYGDFHTLPSINVLNPGQSYNYKVAVDSKTIKNAYVRYTALNGNHIDITLRTSGAASRKTVIVTAIEGFSYSLNVESLYVKDRFTP
ncbi:hypothetical protein M3223_14675 [Paenibacillus pasadenensis]|uniref:hypothetical protein n=1 Tax=Paenibacillus pasadenensis TaxID=217090 RepID=UPI002040FCA4|nr:hypothetical protein [Paenibacillus pasadenensis]MCM3748593.1 hypothetical protein [Paenibacillus pasadenensis]